MITRFIITNKVTNRNWGTSCKIEARLYAALHSYYTVRAAGNSMPLTQRQI